MAAAKEETEIPLPKRKWIQKMKDYLKVFKRRDSVSPTASSSSSGFKSEIKATAAPTNSSSGSVAIANISSQKIIKPYANNANKKKITIEDFDLLSLLGKGSFGKIFLCKEKSTGALHAIKVLRKKEIVKKKEVSHILAEEKLLRTLKHPFLMGLKYSFQTEKYLCFVMEFANGGDLYFHLKAVGPFSEKRARFYGAELVSAVSCLHLNGIIHRDLKLENILLDREGHLKLADFGLCKDNMEYGLTTSTFCGTPEYMAPEIFEEDEYDRCIDWWGVGVVIYEMLCAKLPFYSKDYEVLTTLITMKSVQFPPYISKDACSLLSGLLNKSPVDRLGSGPHGADKVKQHCFFRTINWCHLEQKKVQPPYTPELSSDEDTRYFDVITTEPSHLSPSNVDDFLRLRGEDPFLDFSFQDSAI